MEGALEIILLGGIPVIKRKTKVQKSLFFTGVCVLGCFQLQVTESLIEASLSKLITKKVLNYVAGKSLSGFGTLTVFPGRVLHLLV